MADPQNLAAVLAGTNPQAYSAYVQKQQALMRNQKIAQMLQEQSVAPVQNEMVGNRVVKYGFGQGLTKLADALLANHMNKANDQGVADQAAMQGSMMAPIIARLTGQQSTPMQPSAPPNGPTASAVPDPQSGDPLPNSPVAQSTPLVPSMSALYSQGRDEEQRGQLGALVGLPGSEPLIGKGIDAQHAALTPTEIQRTDTYQGITPQQRLNISFAEARKNAQVTAEPGKPFANLLTGEAGFVPEVPPNSQPTQPYNFMASGNMPPVSPVPGAQGVAKGNAYAEHLGGTLGSPQTLTQKGPDGVINDVHGIGSAVYPDVSATSKIPRGAAENQAGNFDEARKQGAKLSDDLDTRLSQVGVADQSLDQIMALAKSNPNAFGPGTDGIARFKAIASAYTPGIQYDDAQTTKDVVRKLVANLAVNGSPKSVEDLRTKIEALPNDDKTATAVGIVAPLLKEQNNMIRQQAKLRDYVRENQGYTGLAPAISKFNQVARPEIIRHAQALATMTPDQQRAYVKQNGVSVADRQKIQTLYGLGGF